MRPASRWTPARWVHRVAQAAPDPAAPAEPAAPVPDAPAPAPAPVEAAPVEAAPNVAETPSLTDDELTKLAEEEAKVEVIQVGSTLERRTLTSQAPLTVMNRDELNASGRSTVGDIIQALPAQSGAINAQTNNGGDGSTRVDLRGLGSARTLVLLNGRRIVPGGTGADASVDLNTIPLAVIERVEVLKDGASAVYGSDAIGGVVNIVTRGDFHGTETSLYTAGSTHGDGFTYDGSFVTGHTSEDKKGNVVFSAGVQRQDATFAGDRGWSNVQKVLKFETGEVSKSGSTATPDGRIDTGAVDTNGDGMPDPFTIAGCTTKLCKSDRHGGFTNFTAPEDLYNFQPANYLFTPSARYNIFSNGTYKFLPNVEGFFEASYMNRTSDQQLASTPFAAQANVDRNSVYNPLQGTLLDYRRRLDEFGPRGFHQNVDTFRLVTGFQGHIPDDAPVFRDWKWEVSYNYGRTDAVVIADGNLILSRVEKALGPSFRDGAGVARCGTPTAVIESCVPMNILGPALNADGKASITQDMIDYVTFTSVSSGYNEQQTVLAQAHGRVAKLPNNGDIGVGVGADYRYSAGGFTPDPLTATGDTTGNASAPTDGNFNVAEAYAEVSIVPISGNDIAQWLELSLAARAFRYNTFGSGVTGKAGLLFRTVNGIALRGTYSTAFRAPTIGELFTGATDDFQSVVDPCDTNPPDGRRVLDPDTARHCREQGVPDNAEFGTTQQRAIDSGNAKLDPEKAKVMTAGIVLEPPQAPGLSLTADYWRIKIDDAIQTLGNSAIFANCYRRNIESYCQQIHRLDTTHAIDFVDNPIVNVGGVLTSGMDFAIIHDLKTKEIGRLHSSLEAQYLFISDLDNTQQVLHGRGNFDLGAFPKIKANLNASYSHPSGVGAGFNVRYVGTFQECDNNDCQTMENQEHPHDIGAWFKTDLFLSYQTKSVAGTTMLTVGMNNVFDRDPPVIYTGPAANAANSDPGTYDYMGRFVYARLTQQF